MPHPAALKEGEVTRRVLATSARLLTAFRVVALPAFLWMLVAVDADGGEWRAPLVTLYLAVALSDFFDGRLARAAGAAEPRWAVLDVAADVAFNLSSLVCAAGLGRMGPWVPAGVAILAARFALRNLASRPSDPGGLSEDRAGKLAGVSYYVLVGIVVVDVATGFPGRRTVARAGDLVFLYTLFVLWASRRSPKSSE